MSLTLEAVPAQISPLLADSVGKVGSAAAGQSAALGLKWAA